MKTYKVRIARQALDQMESIRKYITDDLVAPQAAVNIIQSFKESIKSLETMPERIKLIEKEPWKSEGISIDYPPKQIFRMSAGLF